MEDFKTAVILAGGKSERMGFDKQLLRVNKEPLIGRTIEKLRTIFKDILVVTNNPEYYSSFKCRVINDEIENTGPLGGIHSGLKASKSRYAYFLACDMPNVNLDYIKHMINRIKSFKTKACITSSGEWIEPFNAFYSKDIIRDIEDDLFNNKTSIFYLVKKIDCIYISEKEAKAYSPNWRMFLNLNTREELDRYLVNLDAK